MVASEGSHPLRFGSLSVPFFDPFSFVLGQFFIKVGHILRIRNHLVSDRINKFEKTERSIQIILKIKHSRVDAFIADNANDIE
jgi:hypothetical protein